MTHVNKSRGSSDDRPCGARWDRSTGFASPLSLPEPEQPRDPVAVAAKIYCDRRHADAPEREKCQERGQCNVCHETVVAIVRAYNGAALTNGE